jgi:hypothetical protein
MFEYPHEWFERTNDSSRSSTALPEEGAERADVASVLITVYTPSDYT